jgi:hypothetical protein
VLDVVTRRSAILIAVLGSCLWGGVSPALAEGPVASTVAWLGDLDRDQAANTDDTDCPTVPGTTCTPGENATGAAAIAADLDGDGTPNDGSSSGDECPVFSEPCGPVDVALAALAEAMDVAAGPISTVTSLIGDVSADNDLDGAPNGTDNCPLVPNPTPQADSDEDGTGDACDPDQLLIEPATALADSVVDDPIVQGVFGVVNGNCLLDPPQPDNAADPDEGGLDGLEDSCDPLTRVERLKTGTVDPIVDQLLVEAHRIIDPVVEDPVGTAGGACPSAADDADGDKLPDSCDPDQLVVGPLTELIDGTVTPAVDGAESLILDVDGDQTPNDQDNCPVFANADEQTKDDPVNGLGPSCQPEAILNDRVLPTVNPVIDTATDLVNETVLPLVDTATDLFNDTVLPLVTDTTDVDNDGVPTAEDNCPIVANADEQADDDPVNGLGPACQPDALVIGPVMQLIEDNVGPLVIAIDGVVNPILTQVIDTGGPVAAAALAIADPLTPALVDIADGATAPTLDLVTDLDQDGVPDVSDDCAVVPKPDGCDTAAILTSVFALAGDADRDGTSNAADNCKATPNRSQGDTDQTAPLLGDACDPKLLVVDPLLELAGVTLSGVNNLLSRLTALAGDLDGDGSPNLQDNCLVLANPDQDDPGPSTTALGGRCDPQWIVDLIDNFLHPDVTAPETTIDSGPATGATIADASPTFAFSSNEQASFQCKLDNAPFSPCSSPKQLGPLTDGQHTFSVRARDRAGNLDETPAGQTFTVDTTAPETTIGTGPADGSTIADSSPSFGFSANETTIFECQLDGASFTACLSPAQFELLSDGQHTFRVRATDAAGNLDPTPASRTFTIDTTAPETTVDSGPADGSTINDDSPSFEFSADEDASFDCEVDDGGFDACTSPAVLGPFDDGEHSFAVRATDGLGHTDNSPASRTFTVDTMAPETTIDSGPTDRSAIAERNPTFAFSADEASDFQCQIDDGGFGACESPQQVGPLDDGDHTFEVKAADGAGNGDATPASRTFTVDGTAPDTTIDSGPADGATITDRSPSFDFSADEDASFECQLDDGGFSACAPPAQLGPLSDGEHTFEVRAIDRAGNTDGSVASRTFTVDSPPDTTIDDGPTAGSTINDDSPSFEFSADEAATFECKVDDGDFEPCTSPAQLGPLGDGAHSFLVRATDEGGNTDATSASRSFTIDTTATDTAIDSGPADGSTIADSTPQFSFSADEPATFECKIDGGAFSSCSSPAQIGPLGDGKHTFQVVATDLSGNEDPTPASRTFTVDTSPSLPAPPQTRLISGPSGSTRSTNAKFAFSSSVPGARYQCKLDGQGWKSCSSPRTFKGLGRGSHTFRVRAISPGGAVDSTPAKRSWKIVR